MNGEGWPLTATYRDGQAFNARTNITNLSADLGATANYNPSRFTWLNFKTTLGTQYNNSRLDQNSAGGTTLPPGAVTASAGATPSASEGFTIQKTWGIFVEEGAALRDRLFLTAAVRSDQNSAFGTKFQRVYYPKASLSWVISDEDFFPHNWSSRTAISNLQLRVGERRVGRAAWPERRAPHVLGQLGEHQEHRRADRDVQRDRQRQPQAGAVGRVGSRLQLEAVQQPHAVRRDVLLARSRTTR